jgi:hypothetical protein
MLDVLKHGTYSLTQNYGMPNKHVDIKRALREKVKN